MIKEGRVPLFVGPYQNKTILLSISSESEMSGIQIIILYILYCLLIINAKAEANSDVYEARDKRNSKCLLGLLVQMMIL